MNNIEELALNETKKTRAWKNEDVVSIIEDYKYHLANQAMIAAEGKIQRASEILGITDQNVARWLGQSGKQWRSTNAMNCGKNDVGIFCAKRSVRNLKRNLALKFIELNDGVALRAAMYLGVSMGLIIYWRDNDE